MALFPTDGPQHLPIPQNGLNLKPANFCCYVRQVCWQIDITGFGPPRPIVNYCTITGSGPDAGKGGVVAYCCDGCEGFEVHVTSNVGGYAIVGDQLNSGVLRVSCDGYKFVFSTPGHSMLSGCVAGLVLQPVSHGSGSDDNGCMDGWLSIVYSPRLPEDYYPPGSHLGSGDVLCPDVQREHSVIDVIYGNNVQAYHWQKIYPAYQSPDPTKFDHEEIPFLENLWPTGYTAETSPGFGCSAEGTKFTITSINKPMRARTKCDPKGVCSPVSFANLCAAQHTDDPCAKNPYMKMTASGKADDCTLLSALTGKCCCCDEYSGCQCLDPFNSWHNHGTFNLGTAIFPSDIDTGCFNAIGSFGNPGPGVFNPNAGTITSDYYVGTGAVMGSNGRYDCGSGSGSHAGPCHWALACSVTATVQLLASVAVYCKDAKTVTVYAWLSTLDGGIESSDCPGPAGISAGFCGWEFKRDISLPMSSGDVVLTLADVIGDPDCAHDWTTDCGFTLTDFQVSIHF